MVPTASVFFNAWHSMKSRSLLCLTFVPDTPTNNHSSQFQMDFQHGSPSLCFSSSRACLCKSNTLNACDVNKFFCFLTCCQRKDELSLASFFLPKLFQMVFCQLHYVNRIKLRVNGITITWNCQVTLSFIFMMKWNFRNEKKPSISAHHNFNY